MVVPDSSAGAFAGFGAEAFTFLSDLADRQDRTWFQAHKATYETAVRAPMAALVAALSAELGRIGVPLRGYPERSVFRIHRDTRFSRDKRPYKTHAGATLTRDGGKLSPGLLYLHFDPAGSFVAAGFYRPDPRALDRLRAAIAADPAGSRAALDAAAAGGLSLMEDEDALKRLPRGFEKVTDPETADLLRRKSLAVRRPLSASEVAGPDLVAVLGAAAAAAAPLLRFGWAAIDG